MSEGSLALDAAKLGQSDKLHGFARLDALTRTIEQRLNPDADTAAVIAHERAISASVGGRTVMDDRRDRQRVTGARRGQLDLFD